MDPLRTATSGASRRDVLLTGAGSAAGVALLGACGGGDDPPASGPAAAGGALAKLADVPVGGAVSAQGGDGKPVIVAQPTEGTAVAFSAICTHMGCTVAPDGKQLACPCHGSTYDTTTGKNTGGPAPRPLSEVKVSVQNGEVVEA
jgi:cytochrome b6-f complex iron-sulfur subunit